MRIYFLSEGDSGVRAGVVAVLFGCSGRKREGSRNGLKESICFIKNIKKPIILIIGDRGLVLVLALIILLVLADI